MNIARILIADDHELVRDGIKTRLETRDGWTICGEAVNGREVHSAAEVRAALEAKPGQIGITGRRGQGRFNSTIIGG